MKNEGIIESIRAWMHANGALFSKLVSMSFLIFGILLVIGAFKDWDWLYKPDEFYHNRWTLGQVSRYMGRSTARVVGFIGGLLLITAGSVWSYTAFTRH